jgi:hypothetical protein
MPRRKRVHCARCLVSEGFKIIKDRWFEVHTEIARSEKNRVFYPKEIRGSIISNVLAQRVEFNGRAVSI